MADKENQSNAKTKRCKINISVLVFIIICLVFLLSNIVEGISFYFYIESGGLNEKAGTIWSLFNLFGFGLLPLSLLMGFIALVIALFRKPRLCNFLLIILGVFLMWLSLGVNGYIAQGFSFENEIDTVRYFARCELCKWNLQSAKKDLLAEQNENKFSSIEKFTESYKNLAMNKNLHGLSLKQIPENIVLIYQANTSNSAGTLGEITAEYHYGRGALVMFGDFRIEFVKKEDFDKLRWEP